jgi:predicted phage terminase large subunit-like protein
MTEEQKQIKSAILSILDILQNNFKYSYGKKISLDEVFEMMNDLYVLFNNFEQNTQECGELVVKRYIPLLDLLIAIDKNYNHLVEYEKHLKNAYKLGARVSLEHYMVYREWNEPEKEKFFEPRYNILVGYMHYLQELECNPNFTTLIFNAPSGYGKTYPKKVSEAWSFGINNTGAILALCSNDDVVKSGSRSVIDEIKSEQFGEVFPNMKWNENDKDFFLKETDEKWKLKTCKLPYSYYAKTTQANVVGSRASKSIHIDDLYPDYKEAMNQALNKYYYNKSITVWEKRFVQNKKPKVCITGTLWASGDYIDLKIQQLKKEHKFFKHPKYPYTYISEDKSCAIIQVPALDYETGESTCPELKSTSELLKEKANMEEYLWETNFQQKPTNPESLIFSYDKLRTYSTVPESDYKGTYAVIDATRKTGKDFFAMPIFRKVANDNLFDYYLIDALFTRTATKDMYNDIVDKIIENNIVFMVIESNVTSELKSNIERICRERGIVPPEIIEKYNVENKLARITNEMHLVKKVLIFPDKTMYGVNTDIGKFMGNLTTYNSDGQNANDDAPDSAALFCSEIIEENSQLQVAVAVPFIRELL